MKSFRSICIALIGAIAITFALGADKADTQSLVGKAAPGFSLQTVSGKDMSLADEKGNVVLLDFWATWCPPCRKSLPHVQALHADEELKSQGLRIFAINSGEDKEKAEGYLKENNLTFAVPLDKSKSVGQKYLVRGIPTTVIIGRDGKVKNVFIGFGDGSEVGIKEAVVAALKEAKPEK